jgi:hypothetical protein
MRDDNTHSEYTRIWALLNGLPTTTEQDMACLFLESKGRRFCIDFGYENAVAIAQSYSQWNRANCAVN